MISAAFTEFRKNAAKYLTEVENGGVVRVLRHGKPIADVVPIKKDTVPSWKKEPPQFILNGASLAEAILAGRREANK